VERLLTVLKTVLKFVNKIRESNHFSEIPY